MKTKMKFKSEKLIKSMNELINFCLEIGMKDLDIRFSSHTNRGEITVSGRVENPPLDELRDLEEILNMPRQDELEEYYWMLIGDGHGMQELDMVGTLVDNGSISYEDKILTIYICRRED